MIIILVIVGISALILVHELGHFLVAKFFDIKVEEFGFGFPPRLFFKKIGETIYSFNLLPFGGFVRLLGESPEASVPASEERRSFSVQPAWKRMAVILAGVVMNFLLGWLIISAVFMIGAPKAIIITDVQAASPAAAAQLEIGDQIIGFSTTDEFVAYVQEHKGEEIAVQIRHNGTTNTVGMTPRVNPPTGQGALGLAFTEAGLERRPVLQSLGHGFLTSIFIVQTIAVGLYQLLATLVTQGHLMAGFVGPVGIFGVANQSASLGLAYLLQLIGLISLNLFLLNALPFPALDGGRFLFILIEKIKGKPLSPQLERSANALGFVVLLLLMIAITVRDVVKLF